MSEREPIDTSTPWGRRWIEPLTQVEYERQRYERAAIEAMKKVGTGEVSEYSVITYDYEPNRPMAPEPNDIIAKKGLRPAKEDTYREVDIWDKIVVISVLVCVAGIIGIFAYSAIKLG